ncbi:hypothetical protein J6P92_07185 [bacterium]|nr:hypothetical protein [bacterium]
MKNLDRFIESLKKNYGDNLISVIAFGSQANVEDAKNNLNLMVVTNELSAEDLYCISKSVQKWVKEKNPVPVIMDINEWYSSFDVYAIEYSDIRSNYRIIYGKDLVKDIVINKSELRLQCESELKDLLLKYKVNFLMNIDSEREMRKFIDVVIKTILVIFRSILRLHDSEVPYKATDIIEFVSKYVDFNKVVMTKLAKVKYENDTISKKELSYIEAELLINIRSLLNQVDKMHF